MVKQSVYGEYARRVDESVDDVEVVPTTDEDRQRQAHVAGVSVVEQTVEVAETFAGSSKEWRQKADAAQLDASEVRRRAEMYTRMGNSRTPADDIVERFTVWYESGRSLNAASHSLGVARDTVVHAVKVILDGQYTTIPGLSHPEQPTTNNRAELLVVSNQYIIELRKVGLDPMTIRYIVMLVEPDETVRSSVFSYLNNSNETTTISGIASIESVLRKVYDYLFSVAGSPLIKNKPHTTDTEIY